MWRRWLYPFRTLWGRGREERLLAAEMQFHLEQEIRLKIAHGMGESEARREAMLEFGGGAQVQEECRDMWGFRVLESIWRDVTFATRSLRKDYGYAAIAILTLALGIGSNTALFSALRSVVHRPLPVADGDRVIAISASDGFGGRAKAQFSYPELQYFRERTKAFESVEELHTMNFTLLGRAEPENVDTGVVGAGYFDFLGIKAQYGRTFQPGEDAHGSPGVLVLSHRYWMTSFGGDPKVVGTTVRMNDRVHTIVGVLPALPEFPRHIDLYMPTSSCPTRGTDAFEHNAKASLMRLYGRMRPGVTAEQASRDLDAVFMQYRAEHKDVYRPGTNWKAMVTPLKDDLAQQARPTLMLLFAITGLVLLVACASVANLSLARMLRREREMAIRAAIGGSRMRLLQQFVVEGMLVSLAAGVLGIVTAVAAQGLLRSFAAKLTPRAGEIALDWQVLVFCLGASVVTGVIFCALPAWRTRVDLVAATREGSLGAGTAVGAKRVRRMLVSAQVAFSLVILIAAGLLLRSFLKLTEVELGFDTQRVLVMKLRPNWSHVDSAQKFTQFQARLLDQVRQVPGVITAGISGNVPLAQSMTMATGMEFEGQAKEPDAPPVKMTFAVAGDGYFDTLKIPVLAGRVFTAGDRDDTPAVAVVNATMAKRRFGGQDPIGRGVRPAGQPQWWRIVGVVGDTRADSLEKEPGELLYFPTTQTNMGTDLVVRTANDPGPLVQSLRRAVYAVDPEQAIAEVETMDEVVQGNLSTRLLTARLTGLLAVLTLLITIAGIGGMAAVSTDSRRTEIGIRLALGAVPERLVGMIVRQEMWMVMVGIGTGLFAALAVGQALWSWLPSGFLFGTQPWDALTIACAVGLMVAAAVIACLTPAVRAVRIDPVRTLRSE